MATQDTFIQTTGVTVDYIYVVKPTIDTIGIPTDSNGNNPVFTNAQSELKIYKNNNEDAEWTFVVSIQSGATATFSYPTLTITGISADTGYIIVRATKAGESPINTRINVYKAKAGVQGPQGIQGIQGNTGAQGSQGQAVVDSSSIDDETITLNTSDELTLKDGGILNVHIAPNTIGFEKVNEAQVSSEYCIYPMSNTTSTEQFRSKLLIAGYGTTSVNQLYNICYTPYSASIGYGNINGINTTISSGIEMILGARNAVYLTGDFRSQYATGHRVLVHSIASSGSTTTPGTGRYIIDTISNVQFMSGVTYITLTSGFDYGVYVREFSALPGFVYVRIVNLTTSDTSLTSRNAYKTYTFGNNCIAYGNESVAIGSGARATALKSIHIGYNAGTFGIAQGDESIALGAGFIETGATQAVAIGKNAAMRPLSMATGYNSMTSINGEWAHANTRFSFTGDCQTSLLMWANTSTSDVNTRLKVGQLGGLYEQEWFTIESETLYSIQADFIGYRTNGDYIVRRLVGVIGHTTSTGVFHNITTLTDYSTSSGTLAGATCLITYQYNYFSPTVKHGASVGAGSVRWQCRMHVQKIKAQ